MSVHLPLPCSPAGADTADGPLGRSLTLRLGFEWKIPDATEA